MHRDFDAARRAYPQADREPVTFTYGGDTFTVLPDPTLGDSFELSDAPEVTIENYDEATDLSLMLPLVKFIRHMLPEEDRPRFDRAHYRIPSSQGFVIFEVAQYIAESMTNHPSSPSSS